MSPWLALFLLAPSVALADDVPQDDDGVAATTENRSSTARKRARKPRSTHRTARPATTRPAPRSPSNRTSVAPAPRPPERRTEVVRNRIRPVPAPRGTVRAYDAKRPQNPLVSRALARPTPREVRRHPLAHHPPPRVRSYRPWYTHWYVHPYYRYLHTSVCVVHLPFATHPWDPMWVPPARAGWVWIPGYWAYARWHPGYWRPAAHPAVLVHRGRYVYVPGWWSHGVYVEGWWRVEARPDWIWVPGRYLADGAAVPGYWRPTDIGPRDYVWEPGFFDGSEWIDGFWRPEKVKGFVWVRAWFDAQGVFHAGYWEPKADKPGQVWIPGWFDGATWNPGYWVPEATYRDADPERYVPEASDGPTPRVDLDDDGEPALALPAGS